MSNVDDFSQASAAFRELDDLSAPILADAEVRIGDDLVDAITQRARRHRRTGRMERGIKATVDGHGLKQTVRIHAGGPVAHLIIGGTRPHRIAAPTRPIPLGGQRFAASVRHPGTRADPFFAAAVDASAGDVATALDTAGADLVHRLARRIEGGR